MTDKPSSRRLRSFSGHGYDKGRSAAWQAAWFATSHLLFQKWWFPARGRVLILRLFGARIGDRVLIRQRVRIHWPWKLTIGNDVWIGEGVWLLNLDVISIGNDVCLSQEALLCTGSHDPRTPSMEFDNAPIAVESGAWVAARAVVLRGSTIEALQVVPAGEVVRRSRKRDNNSPILDAIEDRGSTPASS